VLRSNPNPLKAVNMAKHLEDGGDVNIGINDNGVVLYVCASCKKVWYGQATPGDQASSATRRDVAASLSRSSAIIGDLGFDVDDIA
jgi:hypothetical protein